MAWEKKCRRDESNHLHFLPLRISTSILAYVFTQCPRVADITQPSTSSEPDPSFVAEDEHDVGLTLSTGWREQDEITGARAGITMGGRMKIVDDVEWSSKDEESSIAERVGSGLTDELDRCQCLQYVTGYPPLRLRLMTWPMLILNQFDFLFRIACNVHVVRGL
jgi:hypothetical protein